MNNVPNKRFIAENPVADLDNQTQAFHNGIATQKESGLKHRARLTAEHQEASAHRQALSEARQSGEFHGMTQEQIVEALKARGQEIVRVLRDPNISLGHKR